MEWWYWALEHSRGVPAPRGLLVCAVPQAWALGRGQEARGHGACPCAVARDGSGALSSLGGLGCRAGRRPGPALATVESGSRRASVHSTYKWALSFCFPHCERSTCPCQGIWKTEK